MDLRFDVKIDEFFSGDSAASKQGNIKNVAVVERTG